MLQHPEAQLALKKAGEQAWEYAKTHGVPMAQACIAKGWEALKK